MAQAKDLSIFGLSEALQEVCLEYFLQSFHADYSSLSVLFKTIEMAFGLVAGMGLNIYKHLAYWKRIAFNADEQVDLAGFCFAPDLCCGGVT